MAAYYNEIDRNAAAWLRELIKQGHIAPGEVDERSIEDVIPSELTGFTQCHFFAGIGVWSHSLRRAGWPDDRPVWTGSCPCQPFSAAGKRGGTADERHLWPAFHWLIQQCRPVTVFGEQVASKDGLAWLDIVSSDLERTGYSFGAADLCAAGVGAPHIRQRLFFVANAQSYGRQYEPTVSGGYGEMEKSTGGGVGIGRESGIGIMADANGQQELPSAAGGLYADTGKGCNLRDASGNGRQQWSAELGGMREGDRTQGATRRLAESSNLGDADDQRPQGYGQSGNEHGAAKWAGTQRHAATTGFWANAEWLYCRDGKYRATEPGTFPLAHGSPARVGRLRGYGNAIVAPVAQAFIEAYLEA